MLRRLRSLFATREPLSPYLHTHLDDNGETYVCDESACRPRRASPFLFLR